MWVRSLGQEDPLEKGLATHSSILDFLPGEIPWTEEPGVLQSIGSQRVRHDWVTNTHTFSLSLSLSGTREPKADSLTWMISVRGQKKLLFYSLNLAKILLLKTTTTKQKQNHKNLKYFDTIFFFQFYEGYFDLAIALQNLNLHKKVI